MLFPFLSTPFFDRNKQRGRQEYRRVRAGDDAHKQRERKILGRFRSEYEEHREYERGRERGIDGAYEGLIERTTCDLFKRLFAVAVVVDAGILARPVENHDCIVYRIAQDGKYCRHEKRIHLYAYRVPKKRKEADRHYHVETEREECDEAVSP